ncbi:MAG: hypothetical protein EXR29_14240 [Betaproteobacteria bacterium]|nr:hypothetical protein [Betaproteobacteria bacterium]
MQHSPLLPPYGGVGDITKCGRDCRTDLIDEHAFEDGTKCDAFTNRGCKRSTPQEALLHRLYIVMVTLIKLSSAISVTTFFKELRGASPPLFSYSLFQVLFSTLTVTFAAAPEPSAYLSFS